MVNPNAQILAEIEFFCRTHGMSEAKFGRLAVKDWKLVSELRGERQRGKRTGPRRLWPETEADLRKFMVTYQAPHRAEQAA